MTGKEMCEKIIKADILKKTDGTKLTWDDIWNYSSTGELYLVFMWYKEACEKLELH